MATDRSSGQTSSSGQTTFRITMHRCAHCAVACLTPMQVLSSPALPCPVCPGPPFSPLREVRISLGIRSWQRSLPHLLLQALLQHLLPSRSHAQMQRVSATTCIRQAQQRLDMSIWKLRMGMRVPRSASKGLPWRRRPKHVQQGCSRRALLAQAAAL